MFSYVVVLRLPLHLHLHLPLHLRTDITFSRVDLFPSHQKPGWCLSFFPSSLLPPSLLLPFKSSKVDNGITIERTSKPILKSQHSFNPRLVGWLINQTQNKTWRNKKFTNKLKTKGPCLPSFLPCLFFMFLLPSAENQSRVI